MPEELLPLTQDPDWSAALEEAYEYLTDILSAYTASEQRVRLRNLPRLRLKYRLFLTSPEEGARLESDLWRLGARRVEVPLWMDVTPLQDDAEPPDTSLSLETAGRRFFAGGQAMLWRDASTYEIVEIEAVDAGGLTLAVEVAGTWPGDGRTWVMPIVLARLEDAPIVNSPTTNQGTLDVRVLAEGQPVLEGVGEQLLVTGTAYIEFYYSRPLGNWFWGALWSAFEAPTLPPDATVQSIYAVIRSTRIVGPGAGANATMNGGQGLEPWGLTVHGLVIQSAAGDPSDSWDGVFYRDMLQTSLVWLSTAEICARLASSLFIDGMDDVLTVSGLGFAVYYASATPGNDSSDLDPPVAIPEGQGVAWSYPTVVEARGGIPGYPNGMATGTAKHYLPQEYVWPYTYRSFDVLPYEPDRTGELRGSFRRSLHHLESGSGIDAAWDRVGAPLVAREALTFIRQGRVEIEEFLVFLGRRRGALVPFWMPSWRRDLPMSANLGMGETDLIVEDVGYAAGPFQSPARRFLAFILSESQQYYREVWSAEPGAPGTEVLTLDSALPVALNKSRTLVCYLTFGRLAADDPPLRWEAADVVIASLETQELPIDLETEVGS